MPPRGRGRTVIGLMRPSRSIEMASSSTTCGRSARMRSGRMVMPLGLSGIVLGCLGNGWELLVFIPHQHFSSERNAVTIRIPGQDDHCLQLQLVNPAELLFTQAFNLAPQLIATALAVFEIVGKGLGGTF